MRIHYANKNGGKNVNSNFRLSLNRAKSYSLLLGDRIYFTTRTNRIGFYRSQVTTVLPFITTTDH